jgi:hypothetical protein
MLNIRFRRAVDLDFGATVFRDKDLVADFDIELDLFAIVVEFAGTDRNDRPFLRLLFRGVGNDDASLLEFFLFERLNQHAIAERFHIDCHMFYIFLESGPNALSVCALNRENNFRLPLSRTLPRPAAVLVPGTSIGVDFSEPLQQLLREPRRIEILGNTI